MKKIKILTLVMAVIMLFSSLSVIASAKENAVDSTDEFYKYYSTTYATQKAVVDSMTLEYENDYYRFYIDRPTGRFAIEKKSTGEYVFSNPYNINENTSIVEVGKNALYSQVLVYYINTTTKSGATLSSFGSAAVENQIKYRKIQNGVAVEYALGTVETKRLIPMMIEGGRFDNNIISVLEESRDRMTVAEQTVLDKMKNDTYYKYYDQTDPAYETMVDVWRDSYKCLEKNHEMKIYVFQGTERVKSLVEKLIRKYCTSYTYDDLEYDHELTEYEANQTELPLFRLTVEYTFDDQGFNVSIPAKSIRYNSTNYALQSITLLPYFGCTDTKTSGATATGQVKKDGGYVFIPDGSGTVLNFYKADGTPNVGSQSSGTIYGPDYSKETLSFSSNAETAKIPVFGLVENSTVTTTINRTNRPQKTVYETYERGFTGIVTEGEAFANIVANLGQMAWDNLATINNIEYNSIYTTFSISQSDTVSSGGNLGNEAAMSTTIDTKYTGNYSVSYIMLSDSKYSNIEGDHYYEPSYIGMADAYRYYLLKNNLISKLTAEQTGAGIPLYIESFGSIESKSTFLTFPVTVTTPLTTFEDVQTMAGTMLENGIKNQRWVLTGFANGTMSKTYYPSYLKWTSKLGGNRGFKSLLSYAEDNGLSVFPNFDFVNVAAYKASFSMRKYGAKTMSGRFATLRKYDSVYQNFNNTGISNLVSSASLEELYGKFDKQYQKFTVGAISAKTVGYQLDSDFDDKNPITREDAKNYIMDTLNLMKEKNGRVLVSGGNAYVLPYATDIVELPLDNSGFAISSYSVPFIGMVLHGSVNYAGKAVNMAGDTRYTVLKSLENGAGLYFILSYRNTELVKTSVISEYYSMMYETWGPEVIQYYKMINDAIGDMQNATITNHSHLKAYRLDANVAAVLYGQEKAIASNYVTAKNNYDAALKAVDDLIAAQKDPASAIVTETSATEAYNAAYSLSTLTKYIADRYNVGDVVSVTYTADNGVSKTFYINYNTYNVVVELNGVIFSVPAESFVSETDIKALSTNVYDYSAAEAYTYTTKQKVAYLSAYAQLKKAIADGNSVEITNCTAILNSALAAMTKADNVEMSKTADGRTVYVNYNTASVVVRVSETECREIASQSYIVVD